LKKINLGLIGLGIMGKVHLHDCLRLRNAKPAGAADISKRALQFAKEAGVKNVQGDYEKLLNDPSIDAVIISLPNHLHCECAKKAAEEGKDIFLEKPLARNVAEGEQILSCVKRGGVKLMLGYPLRFSEPFVKLKDSLREGVFGDVWMATTTNIGAGPFSPRAGTSGPVPVPSWWFDKKLTGGGALLDLGSHMINLLSWYFGDVTDARSYLGHKFNLDFEDYALCFLKFEDGPVATVNVGWFSRDFRIGIDFYGTAKHGVETFLPLTSPSLLGFAMNLIKGELKTESPFHKELQYFVDCIHSNTRPSPSGEEALLDLKAISAAYENTLRLDS